MLRSAASAAAQPRPIVKNHPAAGRDGGVEGREAGAAATSGPLLHAVQERRPATTPEGGTVRVVEWTPEGMAEWADAGALAGRLGRPGAVHWIDLADPSPAQVSTVTSLLGLHPLVAEDIIEGNQRAKIEVTDELVHIVLFAIRYPPLEVDELDIVLGDRFLLTAHPAGWDPRASAQFREGLGPIMRRGPDHLLWAICDSVVDGYFAPIDALGDAIEDLQEQVIGGPSPEALGLLFELKRDLILTRRASAPIREVFNQLTNRDLALIDADEVLYFRDVYDHLIRLTDEIDTYRELVSGTLEVYLTSVNNNLSVIMKRLTAVTVVLAGVGGVAGIFGMSEAGAALGLVEAPGFWAVTLAIVVGVVAAILVLRRARWL
jgi:magnesium transporter